MLIVKFQGGLGNQMFQYAFYRFLTLKFPDIEIKADIIAYRYSDWHNGFELKEDFNIEMDYATLWEVIKKGAYIGKVFSKSQKILSEAEWLETSEKKVVDDAILDGFWVACRYYDVYREQILCEFKFVADQSILTGSFLQQIKNVESVSIHVRRGDYVGNVYDFLPEDYYGRAIEKIRMELESPIFFVFSDDLEYVKKRFGDDKNFVYVTENRNNKSYLDMFYMSQCKHNIIANSTFSFWGAELNKNEGKIVIAPTLEGQSYFLPYPQSWVII